MRNAYEENEIRPDSTRRRFLTGASAALLGSMIARAAGAAHSEDRIVFPIVPEWKLARLWGESPTGPRELLFVPLHSAPVLAVFSIALAYEMVNADLADDVDASSLSFRYLARARPGRDKRGVLEVPYPVPGAVRHTDILVSSRGAHALLSVSQAALSISDSCFERFECLSRGDNPAGLLQRWPALQSYKRRFRRKFVEGKPSMEIRPVNARVSVVGTPGLEPGQAFQPERF